MFVGRLVQLQGLDPSAYAAQAEKQRIRTVVLHAQRGDITDRNGVALATTVDARAVYADPRVLQASTKTTPAAAAAALAPLLGVDAQAIRTKLESDKRFVYLAHGLSPAAGAEVIALNLPTIGLEPERKRVYPGATLAANVVGFVGTDGKGLGGLESALDTMLAGADGTASTEIARNGRAIPDGVRDGTPAVPGATVQLTIDRDIQWAAQQAITAQVAATGAASGSVIVMDPATGEILAMATAPTFDPGAVGATKDVDRGNRPVAEVYEPGSTSKVITMAAAIDSGALTPASPITVPPTLTIGGRTFHDAENHGEEHLTLAGVLAQSSNIGTILASQKVGKDRLYRYLTAFGIGQPTGLGFPGESSGILAPAAKWFGSQQYTIAFGQGVAVTSMQVASVYSTIANGGVRVTPSLVRSEVAADGTTTSPAAPKQTRVISESTARQLASMLEAVTSDEGTAPLARIAGYRVAGKTGTAQRFEPACSCYRGYTSSFVGFAPADAPKLVVEVVLQDPQGNHFGGQIAAPVFRDVMSFALQSMKIAPTGTTAPALKLTTD